MRKRFVKLFVSVIVLSQLNCVTAYATGIRAYFPTYKSDYKSDKQNPTKNYGTSTMSNVTSSNTVNEKIFGSVIKFKEFEITVKSVVRSKTFEGKDAILITYDFKNTGKDTVSPNFALEMKGFQNKIELNVGFGKDYSDKVYKDVKTDGILTDCNLLLESNPNNGDIEIDIKPWLTSNNDETIKINLKYPEK